LTWPICSPRSPEVSVTQFDTHNRSAEYDTTILADRIFTNYNSSLLRQHTQNQFLGFIEFSKAYYLSFTVQGY